ncbi:hypothetical protein EGO52_17225 [Curtobacterium flaccumfaciens]|nr:hypothetical protein [Curtobacterium flaccumfaciens]
MRPRRTGRGVSCDLGGAGAGAGARARAGAGAGARARAVTTPRPPWSSGHDSSPSAPPADTS